MGEDMRVITGSARGRKLKTLEGQDTRPTGEKVKEALFSAIQFDLENKTVLDLFAGSGQLGIEALSRGAGKCVFIDENRAAADIVKENVAAVGFQSRALVSAMDSFMFLKHSSEKFDIVFLDPPYGKDMIMSAEADLEKILSENPIVVCETGRKEELPEIYAGLPIGFDRHYGEIRIRIYRKKEETIY